MFPNPVQHKNVLPSLVTLRAQRFMTRQTHQSQLLRKHHFGNFENRQCLINTRPQHFDHQYLLDPNRLKVQGDMTY